MSQIRASIAGVAVAAFFVAGLLAMPAPGWPQPAEEPPPPEESPDEDQEAIDDAEEAFEGFEDDAYSSDDLAEVAAWDAEEDADAAPQTATYLGVDLAEDASKWCSYENGTPVSTPITPIDGDDPRDVVPADDDDGDYGDDPSDTPPPDYDGDDPGDTPPPDYDDGDDPGDTPPPDYDDGDDPGDVGKPPCDELRSELQAALSAIVAGLDAQSRASADPEAQFMSAEEIAEWQAMREKLEAALEELDEVCPGDDGDDPQDVGAYCAYLLDGARRELKELVEGYASALASGNADWAQFESHRLDLVDTIEGLENECGGSAPPAPSFAVPVENTTEKPTVTVVFKAKTSVLEDGKLLSIPQSGQLLKITPSSTTGMPLPGDEVVQEAELDSDRDPMQGRTDEDGEWGVDIDLDPGEWPARYAESVGKWLELLAAANDLQGLSERTAVVVGSVCGRTLERVAGLLGEAGSHVELLCTDPGQAAENLCNNVSGAVDRLIDKGERLADDPLGCLAAGVGKLFDSAIGLVGGITGVEFEAEVDAEEQGSVNVEIAGDETEIETAYAAATGPVEVTDVTTIGERTWVTVTFPKSDTAAAEEFIASLGGIVVEVQENFCSDKLAELNDPYMSSRGSWGQSWPDQWAIQRVGFTNGPESAWDLVGRNPKPVVVAVIDTGLDWHHLDIDWRNLWRNEAEVPDNGVDDDGNGYVDDIIGWDFFADTNHPWDHDGHGTLVTGIIAAASNNGHGIAGINPHARIMVLKGMNNFGHTRANYLARAITYAADNGADVINLSVGGPGHADIEQAAIDYAYAKGVTIVVAAGNDAVDVAEWGTTGSENVITVAATNRHDKRAAYSNHGRGVDLSAPGDDVMGLRARRTDTMRDIEGVEYQPGTAYVGEDKRYYRAGGTSFAAPIVTGVASLLLSKNPELSPAQVKRILEMSAEDVEQNGFDTLTGHGLVDARAALTADPDYRIEARIEGLEVVRSGGRVLIQVIGTADADRLAKAYVEIGVGEQPASWKTVINPVRAPVRSASLGQFDAGHLAGSALWMLRVVVRHENDTYRVHLFRLQTQ